MNFSRASSWAFLLLLLVYLLPVTAVAQCTSGVANDDVGTAVRSLGFSVIGEDTVMVRAGNSFVLDCDAHLQTVSAAIRLTGYVRNGVDPIVAGDLVRCDVYDGNKNLIMSGVAAAPDVVGDNPIDFDFSGHQFKLAAGLYYYLLAPVERRWCYMSMGSEYADGAYQQEMEFYGTWGELTGDSMFNMAWDPNSIYVASKEITWGAIKASYR